MSIAFSATVHFKRGAVLNTGVRRQSGTLETKEILATNLDELNTQGKKWRPRNAVECSPSSSTTLQTSAMREGRYPWEWGWGSLPSLSTRPCGLPTTENSFSPYWTPGPEVPWGQGPSKCFAQQGTRNTCPVHSHWRREGPALFLMPPEDVQVKLVLSNHRNQEAQ